MGQKGSHLPAYAVRRKMRAKHRLRSFRMTLLLSSSVSTVPRSRQSQGAKEFPKFGDAALVGRNAFSGKRAIAHFVMANTSARTASSQNTSCQRYVLWQRSNVN
jgi:hypothetical protein